MSGVQIKTVDTGDEGVRVDRWFQRHYPAIGHGRLQKLLRTGQIRLDGKRAKAGDRVVAGQEVRVPPLPSNTESSHRHKPPKAIVISDDMIADLHQRVLYRDDQMLAIDKPPGLAVQGGTNTTIHLDGMLDELRFGAKERPRLVHRLDKDTSGVLVLARTAKAARSITQQFRQRETRKLYWALVAGVPALDRGEINLALTKRSGGQGERMVASEAGQSAQTIYDTVDRAGRKVAWLVMEPLTGRTHQLRAHAAIALETPIIGDGKYGGRAAYLDGLPDDAGMQLHARAISLAGPSGRPILIEAPLPPNIASVFEFFGFDPKDENAGFPEPGNVY